MIESALYVFDASPLVAGCQFRVAGESVASKAIASVEAQIPSAVYEELVEAVGIRYPRGFIPHSLALLGSLTA